MTIFNKKEKMIEISENELKEIAELLHRASIFLGQGLCDNKTLSKILERNTKYYKKEIKKKELLSYLNVCTSFMHKPEKVEEVKDKCYNSYNELMKKMNPYFTTSEESVKILNEAFAKLVEEGIISSLAGPNKKEN